MSRRKNRKNPKAHRSKLKASSARKSEMAKRTAELKSKALATVPMGSGTSGKSKGASMYSQKRCYEDHTAINIGGYKVYGGSCSSPIVTDADVYVGLDNYSFRYQGAARYPWHPVEESKPVEFLFPITDMSTPKDPKEFKNMIAWLSLQIVEGKKVHIGCIGGHGRTGMVLSALVAFMTEEKDAITYVRKHYCKKAVETKEQSVFLNEHFGIKIVEGTKDYFGFSGGGQKGFGGTGWERDVPGRPKGKTLQLPDMHIRESDTMSENEATPVTGPGIFSGTQAGFLNPDDNLGVKETKKDDYDWQRDYYSY